MLEFRFVYRVGSLCFYDSDLDFRKFWIEICDGDQ